MKRLICAESRNVSDLLHPPHQRDLVPHPVHFSDAIIFLTFATTTPPRQAIFESSKMPPCGWMTKEQKDFLEVELLEYLKVGGKGYKKRWTTLFQKWSQCWPEHLTALPDVPADRLLSDEQALILAQAWEKCQRQLQQWMCWHAGTGNNCSVNNKTSRLIDDLMKPKTCTKKLWEIYSKSYYISHVKDSVPSRSNIVTVRQKIEDALKNEPQEVLDELKLEQARQRVSLQQGGSDDDREELDPLDICRNIQEVGSTLHHVLEHLAKKTGWSFSVIMGGPDPTSQAEEGNHITSLHIGTNLQGQDFSDAYDKYDNDFVEAYGEFLNDVYATCRESIEADQTTGTADDTVSDEDIGATADDEGDQRLGTVPVDPGSKVVERDTTTGDEAGGEASIDEDNTVEHSEGHSAYPPPFIPSTPARPAQLTGDDAMWSYVATLPDVTTDVTSAAQPTGDDAMWSYVATLPNVTMMVDAASATSSNTGNVATLGNIAMPVTGSLACLSSPLQLDSIATITPEDAATTTPTQSPLSITSATSSSDSFWLGNNVDPTFSTSFMELLQGGSLLAFDTSMDWDAWSLNPSNLLPVISPPYTPSTSPTRTGSSALPSGTNYSLASSGAATSQFGSFTPYQAQEFNFGSQSLQGQGLDCTQNQHVSGSISTQLLPSVATFTTGQPPSLQPTYVLPVPPAQASGPLATTRVPLPPSQPAENMINVLHQVSTTGTELESGPLGTIQIAPVLPMPLTEAGLNVSRRVLRLGAELKETNEQPAHSQWKHVPSQWAQRDNAIGDVGKENRPPLPASKSANVKGKKRSASGVSANVQGVAKKKKIMP
ncbi:hypothetical protein JVT61DRAFT_9573 [Boletus reticuloceps]|uniref:Uncharacterized protein n=1 Tax=Boletus reticuloceps TaxID=495285 RepID=A0A8I2YG52_9AGAM|nr:hypothetical protein JVT61DRAFT_9573 [Boletus reticuloceps]